MHNNASWTPDSKRIIIKTLKPMTTNEKFNKFIENAAKSAQEINFIDMVKKQKNLTKIGTLEGYRLYDR